MLSPTVHDLVLGARQRLGQVGIRDTEARLSAEVLARDVLGWDRARFFTRRHEPAPDGFQTAYQVAIARRARREPTSYIVGTREFWGLTFDVSSDVLIPRPETEHIVEHAVAWCRAWARDHGSRPGFTIVDAGTGSGCIAVALARELPDARVVATDISHAALRMAHRNAVRHGVDDRVRVVRTDFLAGLRGPFDLIVCNPPYVPQVSAPGLMPEVREFEPSVALFGGPDGLDTYATLLGQAPARLTPGGRMILELGDGLEAPVRRTVAAHESLRVVEVLPDLQGLARTLVLTGDGS